MNVYGRKYKKLLLDICSQLNRGRKGGAKKFLWLLPSLPDHVSRELKWQIVEENFSGRSEKEEEVKERLKWDMRWKCNVFSITWCGNVEWNEIRLWFRGTFNAFFPLLYYFYLPLSISISLSPLLWTNTYFSAIHCQCLTGIDVFIWRKCVVEKVAPIYSVCHIYFEGWSLLPFV